MRTVELRIPDLPDSVWIVEDALAALDLEAEGIDRGRIWTCAEVDRVVQARLAPAEARAVALAKLVLDGAVDAVLPSTRQPQGDDPFPLAGVLGEASRADEPPAR